MAACGSVTKCHLAHLKSVCAFEERLSVPQLCFTLPCARVRTTGKPTDGMVSVVVTDIEGYSGEWLCAMRPSNAGTMMLNYVGKVIRHSLRLPCNVSTRSAQQSYQCSALCSHVQFRCSHHNCAHRSDDEVSGDHDQGADFAQQHHKTCTLVGFCTVQM